MGRGGDPCGSPAARRAPVTERPIRVVEVLATGSNGGAQEHVYNLLSRIDHSRFEPSVVSLSPGVGAKKIERLGVRVTVIDEPDDDLAIAALTAHFTDVEPDVVHNHMYRAEVVGTSAALALADTRGRRPFIVSTVHSSRVRSADDRALLRTLTARMDRLIAVSRAIERKIVEEGRNLVPVCLIYNGVDLARYDHQEPCCTLREDYGMEPGAQIVGVVARLEPEKGHATLLEAWPAVLGSSPDAYLLVVGEGSLRGQLEVHARRLRIAHRVVFAGRRDDVPAVTAALDIAVLPSYREAQGLTILEAMALGRPVVASNVGGIPEMIDDGVTGLLVPPHDAPALASAITRLLRDHVFADSIARAGRALAHERFSVERMVAAIEDVYAEAAAHHVVAV